MPANFMNEVLNRNKIFISPAENWSWKH